MPPSIDWSANSVAEPVPATAVREQLARVVNSPGFVSSARLCRFLTHIVDRTINGDSDSIKEFSIAIEVFDRASDYDPSIDAIVRVEARRLRAKLKAYYEEGAGASDPVLIGLRPGNYVPIFRWLDALPQGHQLPMDAATRPDQAPSVAVLPFVNMSPEPDQDYFCDGISEEIINSLAHVPGLKVIARTSAFQFKGASLDIREVGQRLGADLVVEGSVRKAGEQLRITAQAIRAENGHHLWSETFRRELKDVFAIQEEVAATVAELFRLHLPASGGQVRTLGASPEAYAGYLRARFLIHQQTPESLQAAAQQLRNLIAAFPGYAVAHSGLAEAVGLLALFGVVSGRGIYPEVKASAERGYALDCESGETCRVLAAFRSWFEHRWDEAEALQNRALRQQPGNAAAHSLRAMTLLCQGNIAEAESSLRRSAELDPLSAADCARMAYLHYVKGDFRLASEHLRKSFDLDRDYAEARFYEGLLHYRQEDYDDAVQCLAASPGPMDIGLLAAAYARLGARAQAGECVEKLRGLAGRQYVTPLAEGFAAIGMGEFTLAFQQLEEAIEEKTNFVNLLGTEPFFYPLRKEPQFAKLLKKLNLPRLPQP
jgi:adenylate cyclase